MKNKAITKALLAPLLNDVAAVQPPLSPAVVAGTSSGPFWVSVADATKHRVEREVGLLSPYIAREVLKQGKGHSEEEPLELPRQVTTDVLQLIVQYLDFHRVQGRSDKERKQFDERFVRLETRRLCELTSGADALEMRPIVDLASRALARLIEGKSPEEIRETFHLPDDLTEEEKLEPVRNLVDDPRVRLLNRLYAKKRKELQSRKAAAGGTGPSSLDAAAPAAAMAPAAVDVTASSGSAAGPAAAAAAAPTSPLPKVVEVPKPVEDTRSVEELLSFIGEGGESGKGSANAHSASKPGKAAKKKKKGSKGVSSSGATAAAKSDSQRSLGRSQSDQGDRQGPGVGGIGEAAANGDNGPGRMRSDASARLAQLLDAPLEELFPEDGFDDSDLDPNELQEFERRLLADWPSRMQELLQECGEGNSSGNGTHSDGGSEGGEGFLSGSVCEGRTPRASEGSIARSRSRSSTPGVQEGSRPAGQVAAAAVTNAELSAASAEPAEKGSEQAQGIAASAERGEQQAQAHVQQDTDKQHAEVQQQKSAFQSTGTAAVASVEPDTSPQQQEQHLVNAGASVETAASQPLQHLENGVKRPTVPQQGAAASDMQHKQGKNLSTGANQALGAQAKQLSEPPPQQQQQQQQGQQQGQGQQQEGINSITQAQSPAPQAEHPALPNGTPLANGSVHTNHAHHSHHSATQAEPLVATSNHVAQQHTNAESSTKCAVKQGHPTGNPEQAQLPQQSTPITTTPDEQLPAAPEPPASAAVAADAAPPGSSTTNTGSGSEGRARRGSDGSSSAAMVTLNALGSMFSHFRGLASAQKQGATAKDADQEKSSAAADTAASAAAAAGHTATTTTEGAEAETLAVSVAQPARSADRETAAVLAPVTAAAPAAAAAAQAPVAAAEAPAAAAAAAPPADSVDLAPAAGELAKHAAGDSVDAQPSASAASGSEEQQQKQQEQQQGQKQEEEFVSGSELPLLLADIKSLQQTEEEIKAAMALVEEQNRVPPPNLSPEVYLRENNGNMDLAKQASQQAHATMAAMDAERAESFLGLQAALAACISQRGEVVAVAAEAAADAIAEGCSLPGAAVDGRVATGAAAVDWGGVEQAVLRQTNLKWTEEDISAVAAALDEFLAGIGLDRHLCILRQQPAMPAVEYRAGSAAGEDGVAAGEGSVGRAVPMPMHSNLLQVRLPSQAKELQLALFAPVEAIGIESFMEPSPSQADAV